MRDLLSLSRVPHFRQRGRVMIVASLTIDFAFPASERSQPSGQVGLYRDQAPPGGLGFVAGHMDQPADQVDVLPIQAQHFTCPQPGKGADHQRWYEFRRRRGQKAAQLFRGKDLRWLVRILEFVDYADRVGID